MQYFLSKEKKEIILNMYYVSNCESEGAFTQATIGAVKGQDISHHLAKEQEEENQGTRGSNKQFKVSTLLGASWEGDSTMSRNGSGSNHEISPS